MIQAETDCVPIVRTRRYVSAPAGAYPAPRRVAAPPSARAAVPEPDLPEPTAPPVAEPALPSVAPDPSAAAALAESAEAAAPAPAPAPSMPPEEPVAAARPPARSPWRRLAAILFGSVLGGGVGIAAGALLLALMEPDRWLERVTDPIGLWLGTPGLVLRASAIAVAAGFLLLGLLIGARRKRPSPPG